MKILLSVIFVFLLCSCGEQSEFEIEPNVFEFKQGYDVTYISEGIAYSLPFNLKFTYNEDDNVTYFIFDEFPSSIRGKGFGKAYIKEIEFCDKHENLLLDIQYGESFLYTGFLNKKKLNTGYRSKGTLNKMTISKLKRITKIKAHTIFEKAVFHSN